MISKECFTAQWLQKVSEAQKFNDKGLIEKVVRAMSLLEALVEAGCPLTFKELCIATHNPLSASMESKAR